MKSQYKVASGIVVVALLWGGASAALFVFIGSQLAVYSLVAMVPILAIVAFLYVQRSSGSSSEQRISEQRAREVGSRFADVYGEYRALEEAYPNLATHIELPFEQVIGDLEAQSISVDRETRTASLDRFGSPDVTTLTSIESDIDELESDLQGAFVGAVREEIQHINAQLRRMEGIIEVSIDRNPDDIPEPDDPKLTGQESWWQTLGRDVEDHREHAREEIGRAAEALRNSMRQADDVDEVAIENHLSQADSTETVDDGVKQILSARDTFRQEASGTFSERRRELRALAAAVQSADVDEYVTRTRIQEFEGVLEDVKSIDDAAEMAELRERGSQLRTVCTEIIRDLESTLEENLETLSEADLASDYYTRPDEADENYASELESAAKLSAFRSEWIDAADDLTEVLDTIERKARVASIYDEIEEHIRTALRRNGEVTGEDLPVKHDYEQFLGLYARDHDVEFDPSIPKLLSPESGEQYSVTAKVSFEDGGQERTARVNVKGVEFETSEKITTYLSEVVEFDGVPYGEYTISAVPEGPGHEPAETRVAVEEDVTVELEVAEVGLQNRLCSEYDDDTIETHLDELRGEFTEAFDSDSYLSTEMDFPVADEYVPCLLAMWGSAEGYNVTEFGEGVLVYDVELISEELQMVAQYNLDPDESMDYDTLRKRFLSAPVPDKAVRDAADSIEDVTAREDRLHKQAS